MGDKRANLFLAAKWRFGALSMASLLFAAAELPAATVLSDNFNSYAPNTALAGQGAWLQTGTAATPTLLVGPTDGSTPTNRYASLGTSGQDDYVPFSATVSHDDGFSITTNFSVTTTAAQSTGDYFAHLSNPAGTTSNFYERIFAKSSGNGYVLGLVDTSGTGSTVTYGTTELALNTKYAVSVAWNFVAGATNDTFSMSVDGTPYLTHTWTSTTGVEPTALAAFNLRQGGSTAAATVQVDDVVVTSAVPEPAAFGLTSLVTLGALVRRRRRPAR